MGFHYPPWGGGGGGGDQKDKGSKYNKYEGTIEYLQKINIAITVISHSQYLQKVLLRNIFEDLFWYDFHYIDHHSAVSR